MRLPWSRRREPASSPRALTELTEAEKDEIIEREMDKAEGRARRTVISSPPEALYSVPVLACVIVRAETLGSLPVHVYRRREGGRDHLAGHPLERLLGVRWNPLLTASDGWRWLQARQDVFGEAFVRVEWRGARPVALWPLEGDVKVRYADGHVFYDFGGDDLTPRGTYGERDVLCFRGPLVRGARAASLVLLAADAIGVTIDAARFYSSMLARGLHIGTYLTTDSALSDRDVQALQERLSGVSGAGRAGEVRVFDRGLEPKQLVPSVAEASLVEQQTWALQEVCRVFRVPPSLVQDWSRSTYTNSEQAGIWFAQHTMLPICRRHEQVLAGLLDMTGERDVYVRFSLDGLLRGDLKSRAEGYQALIYSGVMTRQEARAREELDEIPGLDRPVLPVNMAVLSPDGTPQQAQPAAAALAVVAEAQRELVRRRAAEDRERGRPRERTESWAREVLTPLARAHAVAGLPFDLDAEVARLVGDTPATLTTGGAE